MIFIRNRKKGFSLPETMVSLLLLAIVILSAISAFIIGKYSAQLSKERYLVSNLVRAEMEAVLNADYSSIDAMAGSATIAVNDGLRSFTATKTTDPPQVMDAGVYGYKKVHIKIEWYGGIGRNRRLVEEAVMYVTKN